MDENFNHKISLIVKKSSDGLGRKRARKGGEQRVGEMKPKQKINTDTNSVFFLSLHLSHLHRHRCWSKQNVSTGTINVDCGNKNIVKYIATHTQAREKEKNRWKEKRFLYYMNKP